MKETTTRKKVYHIYMIKNLVNGKCYIGKAGYGTKSRVSTHICNSRDGSHLPIHRAMRKYGWNNFEVTTLYEGVDDLELNAVEKAAIATHRTLVPFGYNVSLGGDGFVGNKVWLGRKHKDDTKAKMSLKASSWQTGRKLSEEHARNSSNARIGLKRSEETKARMSISRRKRTEGYKPVWCLETGDFFPSVRECARALNLSRTQIRRSIKDKKTKSGGLHFLDNVG